MNFPHAKTFNLVVLFFVLTSIISCSKDSDVLKEFVLANDGKNQMLVGNFLVNDSYIAPRNTSIILDVLSNDTFTNPDGVKIIETSNPANGEIVIVDNKTLMYIPGSINSEEEPPTSQSNSEETATQESNTNETSTSEETPTPESNTEETSPSEETPTEEITVEVVANTENSESQNEVQTETFTYTTQSQNSEDTVSEDTATVTVTIYPKLSKSELVSRTYNALYNNQIPASLNDPNQTPNSGEYERLLRVARNGDQCDIYNLDAMQGMIAAFEADGTRKFLNDLIYLINELIAVAEPSNTLPAGDTGNFGDTYLSWYTDSSTDWLQTSPGDGQFQLCESRAFMHVARMLWVMHNSPNLRGEPTIVNGKTYQQHYEFILSFLEVNFWEKWFSRNSLTYQHSGVDSSAGWAFIGWHLWQSTNDSKYKEVYDKFNSDIRIQGTTGGMRQHLDPNSKNASAYQWNTSFNDAPYQGRKISDHGHAARAVKFMVEDHTVGEKFYTDDDMTKLINTIPIFWPTQFDGSTRIHYWLDGEDKSGDEHRNFMPEGWMCLGRFDEILQNRYENMDTSYFYSNRNASVHWGELAYNRAYLENTMQYPENFVKQ